MPLFRNNYHNGIEMIPVHRLTIVTPLFVPNNDAKPTRSGERCASVILPPTRHPIARVSLLPIISNEKHWDIFGITRLRNMQVDSK